MSFSKLENSVSKQHATISARLIPLLTLMGASAAVAHAQLLDFVTVGAAGNRGTLPTERPQALDPGSFGSVAYEFQITRTEIVASEWIQFLRAYRPFNTGNVNSAAQTSTWILPDRSTSDYFIWNGAEQCPVDVSWEMAARYCNWLHNDRINQAWAFESGAYDTTTFTNNGDGTYGHQSRLPGARFWIPSYDEMIKAFYYDPNRYGAGFDGYWLYPGSQDVPLRSGLPSAGGQTNVGVGWDVSLPIAAQYPTTSSPWGLLDTSGGQREWTDSRANDGLMSYLGSQGGAEDVVNLLYFDRIDWIPLISPPISSWGFRVATVVPGPTPLVAAGVCIAYVTRRRR